jgi:PQQ-like domain
VTWSVDGVNGGNLTVGTIDTSGLYVPPATAGTHAIVATAAADKTKTGKATVAVTDLAGVFTYHNDLARTGQNLQEYALTPAAVSGGSFGKRWSCAVDGDVYAQPLYIANLVIGGGTHNVLIVATQHDSVYAIDADDQACHVFWQKSFLGASFEPIPAVDTGCAEVSSSEVGVMSTPVIDPANNVIYVLAATKEDHAYIQRLHALDVAGGTEKTGSPVAIAATVVNSAGITLTFEPFLQLQRAALALANGGVYLAWASYCDQPTYWGWVMRYDAASLAQTAVFNVTPNGTSGGVWMSGGAPAVDSLGSIFLTTGNGQFSNTSSVLPPPGSQNDFGESFLKLDPVALAVQDFYTPSLEATWSNDDSDISSSGVTLLPDGAGPTANPNVLISGDKLGHFWMIDRSHMQGFHASLDPAVQYLTLPGCSPSNTCVMGTPAYWHGTIFMAVSGGRLMSFALQKGFVSATPEGIASPSSQSNEIYNFPSPTPMVTASPAGNAVVWTLDNSANGAGFSAKLGPAVLRAHDATQLGTTLYSSSSLPADAAGPALKFTVPVIANGHVYVGGGGQVTVYGLAQ